MATLIEYKCPCCGGAIGFDSSEQKMVCPYCDTRFEIDTLKAYDEELKADKADSMDWESPYDSQWQWSEPEDVASYICNSCGAQIIGDKTMAATSCPFCDSPIVITDQFAGGLRPDLIIPFKVDKNAAKAALIQHTKNKLLLPKVFKDQNHIDEVRGIYVPFWLFDCDSHAHIRYRATRSRFWSDSQYNYTETLHFLVTREGSIGFDRVPVDGSEKMEDTLMEAIEPYNYRDAVDFQTAYLAGYLADKYDVGSEAVKGRVNERIKKSTEQAFANTVQGFNTVRAENSNVNVSNGSIHYALLPVWILNTSWKGEKYMFAINGQTGKIVGDLPLDKGAYWKWFTGILVGLGSILSIISMLLF